MTDKRASDETAAATLTGPEFWAGVQSAGDVKITVTQVMAAVLALLGDTDGTLAANSDLKLATQKALKTYVDGKVAGLSWKTAVRAATTAAGTLASSFENGDAIDGVTLATGDRILVKNQSTASENGIYTVNASGAPTRASDADTAAKILQASFYVEEGTANGDKQFVLTTNAPITLGSTSLTFAVFTSGGSGDALTTSSLAQFAATTSAELRGVLSDETGTGAAVFATAPTLSNPVVGTQSPGDNSTKAASTAYVDNALGAAAAGTSWKQAVRAASTANVTLASAVENGDTLDGVVLATGDRILLKNQSTASENGIYVVAASGAPARATDADSGAELVSAVVPVSEGTANADTNWVCTNDSVTLGSTSLVFVAFGGSSSFTGGTLSSALNEAPIVTLASASTVNIGAAAANTIAITGTTPITAFDTIAAGAVRRLIFGDTLVLVNGTAIVLPLGNITTQTNDVAVFVSLGSGTWQLVEFQRANGRALSPTDITGIGTVVNVYSAAGSYTWNKPSNSNGLSPQTVEVLLVAAGGGGGSGRKGAAGTVRCGGGGGGGGGIASMVLRASDVGSTVTVTVGAGGTAGAAVTANSTNGNSGGKGGDSSFGGLMRCVGGSGGGGGTNAAGTSGAGGTGFPAVANATSGGAGGAASTTGGAGAAGTATLAAGAGGGAGGGITSANAQSAGGAGGVVGTTTGAGYATVVAAGPAGTAGGGAGGSNNTSGVAGIASSGNGGGGSNLTGNGGDSGFMFAGGGGGGGGGAAVDSVGNSGAGSLGGDGLVMVICRF